MADDDISAKIDLDHFDTSSYLPAGLKKLAAGKAHGHVEIAANIGEKKSVKLSDLNLTYDRAAKGGGIPGSVHITGAAQASAATASTSGLHIAIPGATADVRGKVELAKQVVDVGLRVAASDLPRVLATAKVGPLAKSAALAVDVSGPMARPNADGRLEVRGIGGGTTGIPPVEEFQTGFHLHGGTLTVDDLHAGVAGGTLEGSGSAQLYERSMAHLLASPVIDFRLDGKSLSLEELITAGIVSGRLSFELSASGTAKNPKVRFRVPAGTTVAVLGQPWLLEGIEVEAGKDALTVRLCHVAGKGGGDIRVEGRVDLTKKPLAIDWRIRILDLPLATILAAAKVDAPVSGSLSVDLHVTGTVAAPALAGTLSLSRVRAFDIKLGDAKLTLTPTANGGVAVGGDLFGRLQLDATAGLESKGVRAHAGLTFQNLRLEDLLPELREQGGAAALTGAIALDLRPGKLPAIDVLISKIDASLTRDFEQEDGSKAKERIWLRNATPVHVVTDTERVTVEQATLVTQGGEFTLYAQVLPVKDGKGDLLDQSINADFAGKLDLDLLQPLLRGQFASLRGGIGLDVHARGSVKKPNLSGKVAIVRPVRAEARSFDQVVVIPSGAVRLTSSSVELGDLAVVVDNAALKVSGKVGLGPGFSPTTVALNVGGDVSASVLESIAPSAVSDVSGKAAISATVTGTLDNPDVRARVSLGEIEMRLRGVSRQVTLKSGTLDVTSHEILLRDVKVQLDDEGELLIGAGGVKPGRIHIRSLRPEFVWDDLYLPLRGTRLGYRDGGVEVDDLSLAMELTGSPTDGLRLAGDVRLVSGRYLQDFNVRNLVLSPRINESDSTPFWKGQPLLENLALALRVRTEGDGFVVQNNLAPEIHITIDLGIGGTLARPAISGQILPTDGRFHIIALRGDFELVPNVNYVTFVPTKSLAAGDTPELNLEAQNIVVDSTGNEHTVLMRINGPINQATINLTTNDGLDRNQTMLLLLSGRTTDDISGNSGQVFGMNQQSGLNVLGQASRDVVSSLVEPYVDDTLQMITGRKWNLRPTVGADAFEVKLQARATREFDLELSYLRGFQSQVRYRAQGLGWLYDYVTARAVYDRLTYSLQQGLPMQTDTFRLELTFEYPIRFPNP
jgi:autotransporter translocation and assembly factor TamB